jgi:hypothetical protein
VIAHVPRTVGAWPPVPAGLPFVIVPLVTNPCDCEIACAAAANASAINATSWAFFSSAGLAVTIGTTTNHIDLSWDDELKHDTMGLTFLSKP